MESWRGAAGANSDLGIRLRAAIQRVQDRQWRPAGTDTCLARCSKTRMRAEKWVQIAVHLSLPVVDKRGGQYTEGEGRNNNDGT